MAKYHPAPTVGLVARVERYADPERVIVITSLPDAFQTSGVSLGVDVAPVSRLVWRTEVRAFRSDHPAWPALRPGAYSRNDVFAVTSLAVTF